MEPKIGKFSAKRRRKILRLLAPRRWLHLDTESCKIGDEVLLFSSIMCMCLYLYLLYLIFPGAHSKDALSGG